LGKYHNLTKLRVQEKIKQQFCRKNTQFTGIWKKIQTKWYKSYPGYFLSYDSRLQDKVGCESQAKKHYKTCMYYAFHFNGSVKAVLYAAVYDR